MRVSMLPSAGVPGFDGAAAAPAAPPARLLCPNPGCEGELGLLDGPDGLFCEACAAVVVLLRDNLAVWHCRHAEPQTVSALMLRDPGAPACPVRILR